MGVRVTNEEVFNAVKGKFAGVKGMTAKSIILEDTDGNKYEVEQAPFEREYQIMFFCNHGENDCDSCSDHGSETWDIKKREVVEVV
jgi:hypothetical protein